MCFRLHAVFSPHHDVWWGRLVRTPAMVAKLVTWRCQRVAMSWRFWGPKILIKLKILRGMCITRQHQQVICGNSLRPSVSPCQRPWSQKASTPLTWNDVSSLIFCQRIFPRSSFMTNNDQKHWKCSYFLQRNQEKPQPVGLPCYLSPTAGEVPDGKLSSASRLKVRSFWMIAMLNDNSSM